MTRRPELAAVLRRIGACAEAVAWAQPFRDDWTGALLACTERGWLTWLAGKLFARDCVGRRPAVEAADRLVATALRAYQRDALPAYAELAAYAAALRAEPVSASDVLAARDAGFLALDALGGLARQRAQSAHALVAVAQFARTSDAPYDHLYRGTLYFHTAAGPAATDDMLAVVRNALGAALVAGLERYAAR